MLRRLLFVALALVAGSALFLWSGVGRWTITRALQGAIPHNVTMTTLEGWFPMDYSVATLSLPGVFELHNVHHRHHLLSDLYHPNGTVMDNVFVSDGTLFGVPIAPIHGQRVVRDEQTIWILQCGPVTMTSHVSPWTKTTLTAFGEKIEVTPTYVLLDKTYPYHIEKDAVIFHDDRPATTLRPLRSISWTNDGVVVDIGTTPLYINKRGVQHGPARAWHDQDKVFVELTSLQYKNFQCVNVSAEADNVEIAKLTQISLLTEHNDTIKGTGTYRFKNKELSLNVNIKF